MFIDVTRHGGLVVLRMAPAAIAYMSEAPAGCAIHLVSGETVRANETRDEIEERIAALTGPSAIWIDPPAEPASEQAADLVAPASVVTTPHTHQQPMGRKSRR